VYANSLSSASFALYTIRSGDKWFCGSSPSSPLLLPVLLSANDIRRWPPLIDPGVPAADVVDRGVILLPADVDVTGEYFVKS